MTSDAKVGLLLGLVFIFIIAFIINGLPHLNRAANSNELTTLGNEANQNLTIADRQRQQVQSISYNTPELNRSSQRVRNPQITDDTASLPSTQNENQLTDASENDSATNDIRYQINLPQTSDTTHIAEQTSHGPTPPTNIDAVKTLSKVYTVRQGDSLSKIAVLCYGQEEGNKPDNINKIAEANKLKSVDMIYEGMKLSIPPLQQQKSNDIFESSLFEKVKSISPAIIKKVTPESKPLKQVTVKEKDNLWKIAAENLGNGNRYKEIAKLNKISEDDSLTVGMKLILPEK